MATSSSWITLLGILSLLLGCSNESGYYKKWGRWHYDGTPIDLEAEPVNFKPLGEYFAKDDRVGYYRGIPIYVGSDASDGPSFEMVSKYYAKDKSRVYYCDTERDSKEYWSIKRNRIGILRNADSVSFRLLMDGYTARDRRQLFHKDQIVPVRDLDSYQILEHGFAKDKIRAYHNLTEILESDGASFEVLDSHYAKDKTRIYYVAGFNIGGAIYGPDFKSFMVLEDGYATDGKKAYYRGLTIASQDADSLQYLSMGYAKTLHQVFHDGKLIPNADASTFGREEQFNEKFDATDKSGAFKHGERIKWPVLPGRI